MACSAGRKMKIDQEIKELGEAPSADSLSADTAAGVGPGAPRQAGFPRVTRPLHALSHLARGAGRVGVTSRKRAAPGRARAFVSEASLPR